MVAALSAPAPVLAQGSADPHASHQAPAPAKPPEEHQHQPEPAHEQMQHDMSGMGMFRAREASGTAWLPDTTPMYGVHKAVGAWELMGHGNGFAQLLHESGERGSRQAGSINWAMGMARRNLAGGRLGLRGMFSLEPWTIRGCGYPDLLATGEVCNGEAIHDRQHPHDLFMELAGEYDRPIRGALRGQVYAGLVGEPALGPAAYPHRMSAMANPLAPISHHWFDATHITFGVVTGGVYGPTWRAEASVFNGREPDADRADFDFGPLDSVSARFTFLPAADVALQVSAGHLAEAEPGHDGAGRVDVDRLTASATWHRRVGRENLLAATAGWGRNTEAGESTDVLLLEASATVRERHVWFGRFEVGGKPAHDLDIHGTDEVFTVAKLQAGYTRYFTARRGLSPGIGGGLSVGIVPSGLGVAYGRRVNPGMAVFVTLRPAAHKMSH